MTFFIRIQPVRADFLETTTDAELDAMRRHYHYWKAQMSLGNLILAGPVQVEVGTFGILVARAADASAAENLIKADPSVQGGVMTYELYPLKLSLYEARAEGAEASRGPAE